MSDGAETVSHTTAVDRAVPHGADPKANYCIFASGIPSPEEGCHLSKVFVSIYTVLTIFIYIYIYVYYVYVYKW